MGDNAYYLPDDWMDSIDFDVLFGHDGFGGFSGVPDDVDLSIDATEAQRQLIGGLPSPYHPDVVDAFGSQTLQVEQVFPPLLGVENCSMSNEALPLPPGEHLPGSRISNDGPVSDTSGVDWPFLERSLNDTAGPDSQVHTRAFGLTSIVHATTRPSEFVSGYRIINETPTDPKLTRRKGGPFKCPHLLCHHHEVGFKRKYEWERHIRQKHSNPDGYLSCPVFKCNRRGKRGFPREDKLISHLSQGHEANSLYECLATNCSQQPASLQSMYLHGLRAHHGILSRRISGREFMDKIKKYICPLPGCKTKERCRPDIRKHLLEHTVQERLSSQLALKEIGFEPSTGSDCCPICGKVSADGDFADHLSTCHAWVDEQHLESWTRSVLAVCPTPWEVSPLFTRRLLKPWRLYETFPSPIIRIVCDHCKNTIDVWRLYSEHHFEMFLATDELRRHRDVLFDMIPYFHMTPVWDDVISNAQHSHQSR